MATRSRVWRKLLGLKDAVVEGVDFDEAAGMLRVSVRPLRRGRRRCSRCGRRCAGYDRGGGRRRWRGLDVGWVQVWLEAEAVRVRCPAHGVVVAEVPWARAGARHTKAFEDQCVWLAVRTSRAAVCELMRLSWRTVGAMVERVGAEARAGRDLPAGLERIGIDEFSYRRGQRYLTVVVDHDTGRLVWLAPGRDRATVAAFFEALGPARCRRLRLVSADAADWIGPVVRTYAPQAAICLDPFHVVQWATRAVDAIRRDLWRRLRRSGHRTEAHTLQRARWVLWKAPERLDEAEHERLALLARTNRPLYRAYLLKEALRSVFQAPTPQAGLARLDRWLAWAARSRLAPFVQLARTIRRHRARIEATLHHRLTNARIEACNTQLRLLHRIAYGFRNVQALISLAFLKLGGLCPPLPGREMLPTKTA